MHEEEDAPTRDDAPYDLDEQVGFLLRRAQQRHLSLFNGAVPGDLTAQQFAALARILETGSLSQNELGRRTAMDQSTINGVVQRLAQRGLMRKRRSKEDRRMILLDLTEEGLRAVRQALPRARQVTRATLAPLSPKDRHTLMRLLRAIC